MDRSTYVSLYLLPLLMTLSMALSSPLAHAEGDDWVLVKRFEEQQKKANAGDVQAMYEVGRLFERGRGTETNMDKAVSWFESAAKKGQIQAKARLGILFLEGQGVPQDNTKAYKYLSESANSGVPAAQYFLALMYEEGHGLKANPGSAMVWYKKAASGGYYQAQAGIARLEAQAKRPTLEQPPDTAKPSLPKSAPAKPPKVRLAQGFMDAVLQGQWQYNGRPSGFLPSSATICEQENGQQIKCLSAEQKRDTGFSVITYVTESILTGFSANDEFSASYHNNVLRAEQEKKSAANDEDDSEEFSAGPRTAQSRVQLGPQKTRHKLECTLENANKLVCVKNLTTTLIFENKAK